MAEPDVIKLNGGKAQPLKSKPQAISYQWLDGDGDALDFDTDTWVGQGRAEAVDGTAPDNLGDGAVVVVASTATATYSFHADDFSEVGVFRLVIWVGNGTHRYGSVAFEWEVYDAPGAVPTV